MNNQYILELAQRNPHVARIYHQYIDGGIAAEDLETQIIQALDQQNQELQKQLITFRSLHAQPLMILNSARLE